MKNRFDKRKTRRNALKAIIPVLETILELEIRYYDSIPPTEPNENRYIESEFFIGFLECAVEDLRWIQKATKL